VDLVDWAQVVGGTAAVAALLFAAWQVWLTIGNERRRVQPIVIAHETKSRRFRDNGGWSFRAYLRNSGQGSAFNLRFGVEVEGVRWPYRLQEGDPASGNRQRVVESNSRLPEKGDFEIVVSSLELLGAAHGRVKERMKGKTPQGDLDEGRLYWCRDENAVGQTWETRNPGDRSADLDIHRVRFLRVREDREARQRDRARGAGQALDDQVYEELTGERRRRSN
jgi:hypothetical protein